jgi:mono/diheme cytochrome c family protein
MRAGVLAALAAASLALSTQWTLALDPQAQRGLAFVRHHCASCHAIGRVGQSRMPEAPPFRTLRSRYPVEDLEESFAEGIATGHPSMPQWQLDVAQIRDLIAYLKSLER